MKPSCAKFAIVLKLVNRIRKSKNKIGLLLQSHKGLTRFRLPLSSLIYIQDPLVSCRLVRSWPYSYVSCRACATPTPAYSHQLLLFLIYGRHSHFKANLSSTSPVGPRSATFVTLRTRTKYPLPRARTFYSLTAVVLNNLIYLYAEHVTSFVGSQYLSTCVLVVLLPSTSSSSIIGI